MRIIYLLNNNILKLLAAFPLTKEPVSALRVYLKIKTLEKKGKYDEARKVRREAISKVNPKYQGPILRSEGQDKLYRLKDYEGAIRAFEQAEIAMDKSPFLCGVSQPDSILAGVAISAVYIGDKSKATVYRDKFIDLYQDLKKHSKSMDSLKWHEETIHWLNKAVDAISEKNG